MGWLRSKALPQSMPAFPGEALPRASGGSGRGMAFLDFLTPNEPLYPEPDFVNNADYGFDKNELVYACIMEKATSLPDAPFRVFGPDGQGESRENHPLRQLIEHPNPAMTEFELIELTSIFMDLAGIAFWEIVLDRADRPIELWPLRPDLVRIFPKQNGKHEYGYALGNARIAPLGTNVMAFKMPNPMDPLLGQAPMRPANRAVALDNEATDFVKALLQNRAVPGAVIETEQAIDEAVTQRLTQKWVERFGRNNRGRPAFLQKGMKVNTLGLDLGQLEFPDLRTISESRICMSFGVPPILVGAKVGLDRSTFANYAEARRSLWEETLMPLQRRMEQVIVSKLLPMLEGPRPRRVVAKFDNTEVIALRESEGRRWELATQALRAGGITVNQFCRYVGLPTQPAGDVYLRPAGVVPQDVAGKPFFTPAPVKPVTPPAEPEDNGEGNEDDNEDTGDGIQNNGKAHHFDWKQVPPLERTAFAKDIAAVVEEQREEVMALVTNSKSLLILAPDRFKGSVWDSGKWDRKLAAAIEPHMLRVARAAGRAVATDEPVAIMDAYVHVAAKRTAEVWNVETEGAVEAALTLGGDEVDANVEHVFAIAAGYRALLLATTASTDMNGFGKVDTAKRVGLTTKTWVVTSSNPRPEHDAMDGETAPVSEPFSNGDMWPSGPNCQCDVSFESV